MPLCSSELGVFTYSAAQVKKAIEVSGSLSLVYFICKKHGSLCHVKCLHATLCLQVTHYLGGENYVFWGGREGYQSLLNTDMERELNHMVKL